MESQRRAPGIPHSHNPLLQVPLVGGAGAGEALDEAVLLALLHGGQHGHQLGHCGGVHPAHHVGWQAAAHPGVEAHRLDAVHLAADDTLNGAQEAGGVEHGVVRSALTDAVGVDCSRPAAQTGGAAIQDDVKVVGACAPG